MNLDTFSGKKKIYKLVSLSIMKNRLGIEKKWDKVSYMEKSTNDY